MKTNLNRLLLLPVTAIAINQAQAAEEESHEIDNSKTAGRNQSTIYKSIDKSNINEINGEQIQEGVIDEVINAICNDKCIVFNAAKHGGTVEDFLHHKRIDVKGLVDIYLNHESDIKNAITDMRKCALLGILDKSTASEVFTDYGYKDVSDIVRAVISVAASQGQGISPSLLSASISYGLLDYEVSIPKGVEKNDILPYVIADVTDKYLSLQNANGKKYGFLADSEIVKLVLKVLNGASVVIPEQVLSNILLEHDPKAEDFASADEDFLEELKDVLGTATYANVFDGLVNALLESSEDENYKNTIKDYVNSMRVNEFYDKGLLEKASQLRERYILPKQNALRSLLDKKPTHMMKAYFYKWAGKKGAGEKGDDERGANEQEYNQMIDEENIDKEKFNDGNKQESEMQGGGSDQEKDEKVNNNNENEIFSGSEEEINENKAGRKEVFERRGKHKQELKTQKKYKEEPQIQEDNSQKVSYLNQNKYKKGQGKDTKKTVNVSSYTEDALSDDFNRKIGKLDMFDLYKYHYALKKDLNSLVGVRQQKLKSNISNSLSEIDKQISTLEVADNKEISPILNADPRGDQDLQRIQSELKKNVNKRNAILKNMLSSSSFGKNTKSLRNDYDSLTTNISSCFDEWNDVVNKRNSESKNNAYDYLNNNIYNNDVTTYQNTQTNKKKYYQYK